MPDLASVAFPVRYQPAAMPLCQGGGHSSATAGFLAQGRWGSINLWKNVAGALLHQLLAQLWWCSALPGPIAVSRRQPYELRLRALGAQ